MTGLWLRRRRVAAAVQAALLLGLPFVSVGGQSALRFDLPSLSLFFFGARIWMDEFFMVLTAVLFALFALITLTIVFGRLWCGWACPQTVLSDAVEFFNAPAARIAASVVISMVVAADIMLYFIPPSEFINTLRSSDFALWSFVLLAVVLFANLAFVRRKFCATICPYAKIQVVLYDNRTMLIAYDPAKSEHCMGCSACARACPTGIDIRDGLQMQCINCAECIDACTRMRSKNGGETLVDYHFGEPSAGGRPPLMGSPLRVNVIIMLLASVLFIGLFVYSAMTREAFSITLMRDAGFPVREARAEGGMKSLTGAYRVTIINRTSEEGLYDITVEGASLRVTGEPTVPPGGASTFDVYVTVTYDKSPPESILFSVSGRGSGESRDREISFPSPL